MLCRARRVHMKKLPLTISLFEAIAANRDSDTRDRVCDGYS